MITKPKSNNVKNAVKTTDKQQPTKQLRATTPTPFIPGKCKAVDDPLIIRRPYTNWDKKNFFINEPKPGQSKKDPNAKFMTGAYQYTYTLPNGTTLKAPLRIELREVASASGLRPVTKTVVNEKTGREEKVETGSFQLFCLQTLDEPEDIRVREILNDVYDATLDWMWDHGKEGSGDFDKAYTKPNGVIGPSNDSGELRYPVWYQETTTMVNGKPRKVKDMTVPPTIVLPVNMTGQFKSKMTDDAYPHPNKKNLEDYKGRGFKHIPIALINDAFIGGTTPKVRMSLESTILTATLSTTDTAQGASIAERHEAKLSSHEAVAAAEQELLDELNQVAAITPQPDAKGFVFESDESPRKGKASPIDSSSEEDDTEEEAPPPPKNKRVVKTAEQSNVPVKPKRVVKAAVTSDDEEEVAPPSVKPKKVVKAAVASEEEEVTPPPVKPKRAVVKTAASDEEEVTPPVKLKRGTKAASSGEDDVVPTAPSITDRLAAKRSVRKQTRVADES